MFVKEKLLMPITEYMFYPKPDEIVSTADTMEDVMAKFNRTGNYNLIVVDDGRYVGMISRANIFNAYRQILLDVSQED